MAKMQQNESIDAEDTDYIFLDRLPEISADDFQEADNAAICLGVRKVLDLLHEYDAIDCKYCPLYAECDDDCDIVLLKYFGLIGGEKE